MTDVPSARRPVRMSAGILLYRIRRGHLEVLLAHPGGPYQAGMDRGNWSVPKGEPAPGEELELAARREFAEETGHPVPAGPLVPLGSIRQKGGKIVHAWAAEGDLDPAAATCNTFEIEWPPHSGRRQQFPEVDRVEWFGPAEARRRIKDAQAPLIDRLEAAVAEAPVAEAPVAEAAVAEAHSLERHALDRRDAARRDPARRDAAATEPSPSQDEATA